MKRLYKILSIAFVRVLALSALAVRTPRAVHAVIASFTKDVDNVDRCVRIVSRWEVFLLTPLFSLIGTRTTANLTRITNAKSPRI